MIQGRVVATGAVFALAAATVAGVVGIAGAAPSHPATVRTAAHKVHSVKKAKKPVAYHLALVVVANGPGAPKFTANGRSSAHIVLPAHTLVTVTLRNYDNGASPPGAPYAKVTGTVGNFMLLNGKKVSSVPVKTIAHTFTVPGIGLNVPIPAVSGKAKYLTETFQFKTGNAGTYTWQCFAPCGTGPSGWGGPMVTPGEMAGSVKVG
jgi:hypothetical protein